jgi:hypothetical protein
MMQENRQVQRLDMTTRTNIPMYLMKMFPTSTADQSSGQLRSYMDEPEHELEVTGRYMGAISGCHCAAQQ